MHKNLPLQELFTRLRQAGLSLGIDEYKLLLEALRGGFGLADKAALARLCCTLWVKSPQEKRIFDYHFEQVMGKSSAVIIGAEELTNSEVEVKPKRGQKMWLYWAWGGFLFLGISIFSVTYVVRNQGNQIEESTSVENNIQPEQTTELEKPINTPIQTAIAELISTTSPQLYWRAFFSFVFTFFGIIFISSGVFFSIYRYRKLQQNLPANSILLSS